MTKVASDLYVNDPCLSPKKAAEYLGISPRTLRSLHLDRTPMPGTGGERVTWGYRRSTLNQHLSDLKDSNLAFVSKPIGEAPRMEVQE